MREREELNELLVEPIIHRALEEHWGNGDWTTDLCISKGTRAEAEIITKNETLLSGVELAQAVFRHVDSTLDIQIPKANGSLLPPQTQIMSIRGEASSILKAEQIAINFLAKMCGLSYTTHLFLLKLKPFNVQLLDTRKNTPGLRILETAATSIGGARKHRLCLTDGVLVKTAHIRAAGSITQAVNRLLESLAPTLKIEVETRTLDEVHEAIDAGADLIILKDMSLSEITLAVRSVRGRVLTEASGSITLQNISDIAATGVDFISSDSLVYLAEWADLKLDFKLDGTNFSRKKTC